VVVGWDRREEVGVGRNHPKRLPRRGGIFGRGLFT
jgi:hypothetical protein